MWNASDHAKAMAEPNDSTVLGDFDDATFTQHGITSRFTKTPDGYFVRTEGEDGKLHDYRVKYVFGFRPLQQYLVKFPGGKLQTLPLTYVNLADLYRATGQEEKGEEALNDALEMDPGFADAHYALGLLKVRQRRVEEGLGHLKRASELRPEEPRFAYAYAIGLNSTGDGALAVSALEETLNRHPYNADVLVALVTIQRDRGNAAEARRYAGTLARLWPQDESYARLSRELAGDGTGRAGPGKRP